MKIFVRHILTSFAADAANEVSTDSLWYVQTNAKCQILTVSEFDTERRICGMRREFLQNMFEANIQEASIVLKKETLTSKDMEDVMSLLNDARKYAWRIKYLVEAEKQY